MDRHRAIKNAIDPRFVVTSVEGPILADERRFYSNVNCSECHKIIKDTRPVVVRVKTKSGADLSVFIHTICLSSKVLADEVLAPCRS